MRRPKLRASSAVIVAALLLAGCGPGAHTQDGSSAPAGGTVTGLMTPPVSGPVYSAEKTDRDLGPVAAGLGMHITLTLRERNTSGLDTLLAQGGRMSPVQWAKSYGPSPAGVSRLRRALTHAGISSTWQTGQASLALSAKAAQFESFFGDPVHRFSAGHGSTFYAPLRQPQVPTALAHEVVAVSGMDDYQRYPTAAIIGADGVTPDQMASFYDLAPLRKAGIDGSGITVMFPEWAAPPQADLNAFSNKFGLPAINLTVETDASQWGAPPTSSEQGWADVADEAAMDVEIVHGLAPGAREIVYVAGAESKLPEMLQAMVSAHPTAVLSSSVFMHWCSAETGARQDVMAEDAIFAQAAAQGTSMFWAAGDRGAFACLQDANPQTEDELSLVPDASDPHVTAVGGTAVFLSSTGAYYKESAWGEPLEQWGGGGGFSTFFPQPSWQKGPGIAALTGRGVPDVSADADSESGWDIFVPVANQSQPFEAPGGGTSAAAPCWAGVTALIDEDLMQKHLRTVGFANPALYYFATNPAGLPAPAFHQVTEGSNLHFPATAGWNPATGLGSPDVAHLADDFEWYDKTHPVSS